MLKKLSVIALAIVMILSVMIPLVSADKASALGLAATTSVAADEESGLITINAGDEIRVTFATTENTGLYALQFDIVFNPDVIDVVGKAADGSITVEKPAEVLSSNYSPDHFSSGNKTAFKEIEAGRIQFATIFGEISDYVGDLFTILFKVAKIEHGESIIKFENVKAFTNASSAGKLGSDDIKTNELALLGHTLGDVQTVAPACETEGYSLVKCTGCNFEYKFDIVEALGHDVVIDEAVEATKDTEGKTEGKHCARCGKVLVAQETIPVVVEPVNLTWLWIVLAVVAVAAIVVCVVVVLKKKKAGKTA